jgi:hypothetical protein
MEAEDYFQLVPDVKYQFYTVQKLTRIAKLVSARFMVKFRPVGPTQTQLIGKIAAHSTGAQLVEGTATDFVMSGPFSKTVTLKNCEIFGAGFEFGGTRLGSGDVGMVTSLTFSGGQPGPQLIFSA